MDARSMDALGVGRRRVNSQWELLEFVICVGIITAVLGFSVKSVFAFSPHMRPLGALLLSTSAKLSMMEYRAEHGEWPAAFVPGDKNLAGNPTFRSVATRSGAMDFVFSGVEPSLTGQVLTVRAWQSPDAANLPVAWSCGHRQADPLLPAAEDRTTLSNPDLVSPCRSRTL